MINIYIFIGLNLLIVFSLFYHRVHWWKKQDQEKWYLKSLVYYLFDYTLLGLITIFAMLTDFLVLGVFLFVTLANLFK